MSGAQADFASELIVRKDDNILVQWGKMLTSNICSKWWIAPLLVIAVIYLYWKLMEKSNEGMSSVGLSGRQVASGITNFAGYRGTGETLSDRHNSFGEAPSFWSDANAEKAAKNWNVTKTARALNNAGLADSVKVADGEASGSDASGDARVAEAFNTSDKDAELASSLVGN